MATKVNYSADMVSAISAAYEANRANGMRNSDNVKAVGAMLEADFTAFRGSRSIISKLSREGVYVKEEAPVKAIVDNGPTKKELANTLEARLEALGLSGVLDVANIMNATKAGFLNVLDLVNALTNESATEQEGEEA